MSVEGRKSLNDSGDLFESIILSSPSSDLHQSDDLSYSADTLQFIEEMICEQPPTLTQPQALFTQQLPFFTQPPSPQLPPQPLPIQSPQPNLHQIHTQQPQLPNQQLPPNIFSPTNNQNPQLYNPAGQQIASPLTQIPSPNHFNPNAFQPQVSRPLFVNFPAPQQPQQQSINA